MTKDNQCNHSEAIAKDMYYAFLENQKEGTNWEGLPDDDKAGWLNVAEQALPIIAKHAANDIRVYLDLKASVATGWKKWLYWAGAGIVADSDPQSEWQETQSKARAMLRAAEIAEAGLDTRL